MVSTSSTYPPPLTIMVRCSTSQASSKWYYYRLTLTRWPILHSRARRPDWGCQKLGSWAWVLWEFRSGTTFKKRVLIKTFMKLTQISQRISQLHFLTNSPQMVTKRPPEREENRCRPKRLQIWACRKLLRNHSATKSSEIRPLGWRFLIAGQEGNKSWKMFCFIYFFTSFGPPLPNQRSIDNLQKTINGRRGKGIFWMDTDTQSYTLETGAVAFWFECGGEFFSLRDGSKVCRFGRKFLMKLVYEVFWRQVVSWKVWIVGK